MSHAAHSPGGGHETRDISMRAVVWTAVGFVALGAVGMLLAGLYFSVLAPSHPTEPQRSLRHERPAGPLPPEPRLQVAPWEDMQAMRSQEQELLHGYAWVDKPGGRARIPIERAMEILAEREAR